MKRMDPITAAQISEVKAFSELAEEILLGKAYKVTKFLGEKRTLKATRKRYKKGVVHNAIDIVFTLGKPNYEEREFIRGAKKMGMAFPLNQLKVKFPPEPKK